jgi:hypothetical protein
VGLDQAFGLKLGVGGVHGESGQSMIGGELPNRGQAVSGLERPARNPIPDPINDLAVQGGSTPAIERQLHRLSLSFLPIVSVQVQIQIL